MKKVFIATGVMLMSLMMSLNVMAEPNGFVSSPTGNAAPVVVESANVDENCGGEIIITPYAEKEDLHEYDQDIFVQAYNEIKTTENIALLNSEIKTVVSEKKVKEENLGVSDLFFVDYTNCHDHNGHSDFKVKLQADTLAGFVMLLHQNGDEWEIVEDAYVEDGEYLHFAANKFGPYAVVVDINAGIADAALSVQFPWIYLVITAAAVLLLIILFKRSKKDKGVKV